MQQDVLQDFFIYVPTLDRVDETLTQHATNTPEVGEKLRGLAMDKKWQKIALAGQLVIYAKLPKEETNCA
jgi:hypothetical protein